jgi:urea transport system substrate-binding protein
MMRRKFLAIAVAGIVLAGLALGLFMTSYNRPIKVGILHSLSGTMAISETAVVDAALMAIDEINAAGGLLGRRIEPVIADGASNPAIFAREAERLIKEEAVSTIFGCWTSACRRTIRPVIEANNHLLFYPVQYEGLEQSPNIVYLGAAPNQQIVPALEWALRTGRKRLFLVGSDYVFPRVANAIIHGYVEKWRGEIVGERYLLLGSQKVDDIVAEIVERRPDAILNTINGDSNIAFFRALRAAGITPKDIVTISFSISENELVSIDPELVAGDIASWNYFQSLDEAHNHKFVADFKARYGKDRVIGDPMVAAYEAIYLWARVVAAANSAEVDEIRARVGHTGIHGPGGIAYIDAENQHLWKKVRLGRIRGDGQFDIIWSSEIPIRPEPYPALRPRAEWDAFLKKLYDGWGGQWANPGPDKAG